jgi:hypothetical protein
MGLVLRILCRTSRVVCKWFGSGFNSDFAASTVDGTPSEAESLQVWWYACPFFSAIMYEAHLWKICPKQNLLITHATGGTADPNEYKKLRQEIVNNPLLKDIAPRFLRTCRSTAEF